VRRYPARRVPRRRGPGAQPDQPQRAAGLPGARPVTHPGARRRRPTAGRRRARLPAAAQRPAGGGYRGVITELLTPAGRAALSLARDVAGPDPLVGAAALRRHGIEPALAAAAVAQVELRVRAVAEFGADAQRMFFTR